VNSAGFKRGNMHFEIWGMLGLGMLAFAQIISFSIVSRSRNRGRKLEEKVARLEKKIEELSKILQIELSLNAK